MRRVKDNGDWTLFDPAEVGRFLNTAEDFTSTYQRLEGGSYWQKHVPARVLFGMICRAQSASGGPAILYGDKINRESGYFNSSDVLTGLFQS